LPTAAYVMPQPRVAAGSSAWPCSPPPPPGFTSFATPFRPSQALRRSTLELLVMLATRPMQLAEYFCTGLVDDETAWRCACCKLRWHWYEKSHLSFMKHAIQRGRDETAWRSGLANTCAHLRLVECMRPGS
jgi:hypothetical protein